MIAAQCPGNRLRSHYVIRPNRSLSWHGVLVFFAAAATVTLTVALMFAAQGAWMILPFAGLELIALAACLYICARKNNEQEVIHIDQDSVKIEKGRNKVRHCVEFQRHWVQIRLAKGQLPGYPSRLTICSMGREVEIGSALLEAERISLASELRQKITN